MTNAITDLLAAIEAGIPVPADLLAPDVVVDATVPDWRMTIRGHDAVRRKFAAWFSNAGRLEEVARIEVPGGEIVRFLLTWTENGVPHATHQAHFFEFDESGRISCDEMYCGGRWDAGLLAKMEEAGRVSS